VDVLGFSLFVGYIFYDRDQRLVSFVFTLRFFICMLFIVRKLRFKWPLVSI